MSFQRAHGHDLLGRLARDVAAAVHRRGLASALGEAMHRDLHASTVELALPHADHSATFVLLRWEPHTPVVERTISQLQAKPEAKPVAQRVRGGWQIDVPIPLGTTQHGKLSLGFAESANPPIVASESELLLAVGGIVGMACHGCDLVAKVAALSRRAHREKQQLQRRLSELGADRPIIAVSHAMRDVLEQIELVAPHPTTVLIRGESGTGKELLARHVHELSDRATGAFVAVNCAALPETLIESELFGHEKGAFTGAGERHIGRFERAHGGTLFLDEIGELPANVQGKLLRALQERLIERVGGREPIAVDVRIVAATHRRLEAMVEEGSFRADLFYRLDVFPIHVPPLRDRPEDIADLARAKLRSMCTRLGQEVPELSQRQLRTLTSRPWPGNVRELENYLERALILSAGKTLVLPEGVDSKTSSPVAKGGAASGKLSDVVRQAITAALDRSGGKIYGTAGAAAALGMKPSTLQSKMAKLGIQRKAAPASGVGRGD